MQLFFIVSPFFLLIFLVNRFYFGAFYCFVLCILSLLWTYINGYDFLEIDIQTVPSSLLYIFYIFSILIFDKTILNKIRYFELPKFFNVLVVLILIPISTINGSSFIGLIISNTIWLVLIITFLSNRRLESYLILVFLLITGIVGESRGSVVFPLLIFVALHTSLRRVTTSFFIKKYWLFMILASGLFVFVSINRFDSNLDSISILKLIASRADSLLQFTILDKSDLMIQLPFDQVLFDNFYHLGKSIGLLDYNGNLVNFTITSLLYGDTGVSVDFTAAGYFYFSQHPYLIYLYEVVLIISLLSFFFISSGQFKYVFYFKSYFLLWSLPFTGLIGTQALRMLSYNFISCIVLYVVLIYLNKLMLRMR